MGFLNFLAALSEHENRQQVAKQFAEYLHAESLIVFIPDPEIDILLPGPGFNQMLYNGKSWRKFLEIPGIVFRGQLPYPNNENLTEAIGIRSTNKSVAVLIGGNPSEHNINRIKEVLPILSALFIQEQQGISLKSIAYTATKSSARSDKLLMELDSARKDLMGLYSKNADLLKIVQNKNNELTRINNELDSFIYTASHDLRAPITNIEGLIYVLEDYINERNDEEVKKVLEMVKFSIDKFKQTINDLADISKMQNLKDVEEIINMPELIDDVKIMLSNLIAETSAVIVTELQVESIKLQRKAAKSILYNLISNSIKYRKIDQIPKILVRLTREGNYLLLEVEDNGLGLNEVAKEKLFSMFRRFHDHVEGTGIGLYIVKKLVDNAGGQIKVISQEGEGTTFKILLPVKENIEAKHVHLTNNP